MTKNLCTQTAEADGSNHSSHADSVDPLNKIMLKTATKGMEQQVLDAN
jgi:hypothetical protein